MKDTTAFEKSLTSIINIVVILIIFTPIYFFITDNFLRKIILIWLFFVYNLLFLLFNNNRCIWMIIMKTNYDKIYSKRQHFLYIILYTLSFSTLFFWIYFPFDLFLFNILILQLPIILLTKTTLHGYLSGNIKTIKDILN